MRPTIYVSNDPRETEDHRYVNLAVKAALFIVGIALGYAWAIFQEMP